MKFVLNFKILQSKQFDKRLHSISKIYELTAFLKSSTLYIAKERNCEKNYSGYSFKIESSELLSNTNQFCVKLREQSKC